MSYILDALRRLEQDKVRVSANPIRTVLHGGGPHEGTRPGRKRIQPLWLWLPAGFLVLLLAVGITFWVARSTAPATQEGRPAASVLPQPADPRGASGDALTVSGKRGAAPLPGSPADGPFAERLVPRVSLPPASLPAGAATSLPAPETSGSASAPDPLVAVPSLQEPVRARPAPESIAGPRQPESRVIPAPAPVAPPPLAREQRGGGSTPGSGSGSSSGSAPTARLSSGETGLRISAIVWSSSPGQRFAIVNLKTVHEGDFVDDEKVVEIREDEVVFEKAGRRFSVGVGKR